MVHQEVAHAQSSLAARCRLMVCQLHCLMQYSQHALPRKRPVHARCLISGWLQQKLARQSAEAGSHRPEWNASKTLVK